MFVSPILKFIQANQVPTPLSYARLQEIIFSMKKIPESFFLPKDSPSTLSCIISFVDNLMILSEYSDEGEEGILVFKKN